MQSCNENCRICQSTVQPFFLDPGDDNYFKIRCNKCGTYRIHKLTGTDSPRESLSTFEHIVSAVTRIYWETYKKPFSISDEMVQSFEVFEKRSPFPIPRNKDVVAKSNYILHHCKRKSEFPGMTVSLDSKYDHRIGFCRNNSEFIYCLQYLVDLGYLSKNTDSKIDLNYKITPTGWAYLSGIGADSPNQAFIAMSFHSQYDEVWKNGIEKGILAAEYKPLRIDRKDHNNRIDDEIVAEIRKSRFVVADLTSQNAGAYFEAGLAMGLGKPVIWTCEQQEIDDKKVHFDTRQYSIVSWNSGEWPDFALRLQQRIEATIGRGTYNPDG